MGQEAINILWTGGWDSTFRILQLSGKEIIIRPYYVTGDNRRSEKVELNTMHLLTEEILNLNTTKCNLRELITVKKKDIESDNSITQAYKNIRRECPMKKKIGTQYEWLATFSKSVNNLELCIEKGSVPHDTINAFGVLERNVDELREEYFVVGKESSSEDLIKVFGSYHYPLLSYSKLKMKQIAEEKGFINLMNKTWFCHHPRGNQPCGRCSPCKQVIDGGLRYRL